MTPCPVCQSPTLRAEDDRYCPVCAAQDREPLVSRMGPGQTPRVVAEGAVRGTGEPVGGNPSRSKYRNKPETVDGIRFASQGEARRYRDLVLMEAAGEIESLEVHPKYDLVVSGVRVGRYTADYRYRENGAIVVEDFKCGPSRTEAYGIRKRLMSVIHGIEIRETAAK